MVGHEHEREEFPIVADHGIFQAIEQILPLGIIAEDPPARISP